HSSCATGYDCPGHDSNRETFRSSIAPQVTTVSPPAPCCETPQCSSSQAPSSKGSVVVAALYEAVRPANSSNDSSMSESELNTHLESERRKSFDINKIEIGDDNSSDGDKQKVAELLTEYSDRFAWNLLQVGTTNVLQHEIHLTDDTPIRCRPFRVSAA